MNAVKKKKKPSRDKPDFGVSPQKTALVGWVNQSEAEGSIHSSQKSRLTVVELSAYRLYASSLLKLNVVPNTSVMVVMYARSAGRFCREIPQSQLNTPCEFAI